MAGARPPRLKLSAQPLEQDIVVLTLRCLGQEQWAVIDGELRRTGLYVASDGSMFWRQNSGAKVCRYRKRSGEEREYLFRAGVPGTADILGVVRGRLVGLECKRPGEKQRQAQVWWQAQAERAGAAYRVFETPGEAQAFVNDVRRMAA